jgi:phosphatidylserine/phosphatidylglycerophosphate/cardiolipin synthase-like enzyme
MTTARHAPAIAALILLTVALPAPAQERLCDTAFEDCRAAIIQMIRAENVGLDVSMWFMTDTRYSVEIIRRWQAGVPVRILLDLRADENYPANASVRQSFISAGIPIRHKTTAGINHWKMILYAGQAKLHFSAANFAEGSYSPVVPYTSYVDEAIYFTDDPAVVHTFMTKFDDLWTDTTNYANLTSVGALARHYPTYPRDPELNFPPDGDYENRLVSAMRLETQSIDAVMFRITSARVPDEMIRRLQAGVPVRLITDRSQYRNPTYFWHSYNIDRMFVAGIPIRWKTSIDQVMHQKSVVLRGQSMAVFGSSNWTGSSSHSQREHNYFTRKPWLVEWFAAQFLRKWNNQQIDGAPINPTMFVDYEPGWPERPVNVAPADAAVGTSTSAVLRWEGGWWAHKYDVHFGTTNPPPVVAQDYMPGAPTAGVRSPKESFNPCDPPAPFVSACPSGLSPGTTYYWMIRSKTMLGDTRRITGPVWSFTTGTGSSPTMSLDTTSLQFGATTTGPAFAAVTSAQQVRLSQTGSGTTSWRAVPTHPWIQVTPSSGTGAASLSIAVVPAAGLPLSGSLIGGVQLNFSGAATGSATVAVALTLTPAGTSHAPVGTIDSPADALTGVTGSVPFTGWAIDDVEVVRVTLCRAAVAGEVAMADPNCGGTAQIFVGTAAFVDGARPDVAAQFPASPLNERAGWGFMVLTNMLPNQGNGTFVFHGWVEDREGHRAWLGARTMTCTNATGTLPFGTIDTPTQGGVASGTRFVNFGWVLTPQPKAIPTDGSTITVLIDGVPQGRVSYNHERADIEALFPGFRNTAGSNGAVGYRIIDTTRLTNGLHTISWTVVDDQGAVAGIGSRYFTVSNGVSAATAAAADPGVVESAARSDMPVLVRHGWDLAASWQSDGPDDDGRVVVRGQELDRVELKLRTRAGERYTGHVRVNGALAALPVGSNLDGRTGSFTWAPGVGFLGAYDLVFVRWDGARAMARQEVRVILAPKRAPGTRTTEHAVAATLPSHEQHPLHHPVTSRRGYEQRTGRHQATAEQGLRAQPLNRGPEQDRDAHLADLDAGVEEAQRSGDAGAGRSDAKLAQGAGEAEAVDQAERERQPPARVDLRANEILESDEHH